LFEFFRVIFTHFTSLFRPQGSKYLVDIYPDIGGKRPSNRRSQAGMNPALLGYQIL